MARMASFYRRFGHRVPGGILLPAVLAGCSAGAGRAPTASNHRADSMAFYRFLAKGDSVYAEKRGLASFQHSLLYFDSANALAERNTDSLMCAEALFAKGRVYDAWGKDQAATVGLFEDAAEHFRHIPGKYPRYLYVRHLVAHAYEKGGDSAAAADILGAMVDELRTAPPGVLAQLPFTAEMALISTEIGNYPLADSILRLLTHRAWIANDPATYDYLDHYYLTQSRLDAYWRHRSPSPYFDSLRAVAAATANPVDRQYYQNHVARLAADLGLPAQAYAALREADDISDSLNNGAAVTGFREALERSESESEKKLAAYEQEIADARQRTFWLLLGLLGVITLLSVLVYRKGQRYKAQSRRLAQVNTALDEKVVQVELLNKEIQHRVKNNLHMIYSLLSMQERKSDNPQTVQHLKAARMRVESVAALHDHLLQAGACLDFTDYIKGLVASVVACLADEKQVVTHITAEPISGPAKSYFALSLILNEWVTNSIKYALPAAPPLQIHISLRRAGDRVHIAYSDNGTVRPGVPASQSGLGLQIIGLLGKQLAATIEAAPDHPYHYCLSMPHGS